MRVLFTFHDPGMVRDFLGPNMDLGKVALLPGGQQLVPCVVVKVLVIHFHLHISNPGFSNPKQLSIQSFG